MLLVIPRLIEATTIGVVVISTLDTICCMDAANDVARAHTTSSQDLCKAAIKMLILDNIACNTDLT